MQYVPYCYQFLQRFHSKKSREAELQITKMLYTAAARAATYIVKAV